jgi:hypothetical protein
MSDHFCKKPNDITGVNNTGTDRSVCDEANCIEGSSCLERSGDAVLRLEHIWLFDASDLKDLGFSEIE